MNRSATFACSSVVALSVAASWMFLGCNDGATDAEASRAIGAVVTADSGGDPDAASCTTSPVETGGTRFFDPNRFDRSCASDGDCVIVESIFAPIEGDDHLCGSGCCSAPAIRSTPEMWRSYGAVTSACTSTIVCTMKCTNVARCIANRCESVPPPIYVDGGTWYDPDGSVVFFPPTDGGDPDAAVIEYPAYDAGG